jgi:hypothetical protein
VVEDRGGLLSVPRKVCSATPHPITYEGLLPRLWRPTFDLTPLGQWLVAGAVMVPVAGLLLWGGYRLVRRRRGR